MVCLAGGVCSVYRAGSSVDGADFDLVCWRRSDCVCPVDRGSESLHPDGSVCRCFIPSFVFNKTIAGKSYIYPVRTNVDALVGKKARVTAEIDNDEARGTAMVSGQEWTARSADGSRIPKDTMVQIQAVSGVKLIVSKCKEE